MRIFANDEEELRRALVMARAGDDVVVDRTLRLKLGSTINVPHGITLTMTEQLDALRPLRTFEVGEWDVTIFQLVSGSLAWQALRLNINDPHREGVFPVGFSVDDAEAALRNDKTLRGEAP